MSIARRVTQSIMENTWSHLGVQDFHRFRAGLAISTGIIATGAASYGLHSDKRVAERNPWMLRWILCSASGAAMGLTSFLIAGSPATVIGLPVSMGMTCLGMKLSSSSS